MNSDLLTGLEAKRQELDSRLLGIGRLMVAYSGGTDSAYLAWAATQAVGRGYLELTGYDRPLSLR